jgi:tRNA 5-methylaminomethyl-2-thiouridine biosynthesis bifunctional protein
LSADILSQYPPLTEGFHSIFLAGGRIRLLLGYGDVADVLPQASGAFDAVYLDGFARVKNPQMWDEALFPQVAGRMKPGATLATFSAVGAVRRGFAGAGVTLKKQKGFGIKFAMLNGENPGTPPEPARRKTVAVLGGGIAGTSVAAALALRGHAVTIVDRHDALGAETSGNPAGILYPKLTVDDGPMGLFHRHGFCFSRARLAAFPLPSWRETGVLHMDMSVADAARHREIIGRRGYGADFALYRDGQGLFLPHAGMLSPPQWCAALGNHENITKITAQADRLERNGDVWRVLDAAGADIVTADAVVIATGWSSKAFSQAQWLPLQSLRGQMTVLRATEKSAALSEAVCHDGYITPAVNGLHCAGATFSKEEPPAGALDHASVRAADDAENLDKLQKYLPQLGFSASDIHGSRAGFRVTTPDKLPVVGPAPDFDRTVEKFAHLRQGGASSEDEIPCHEGLYLATGFGAHGLSGAPLAGDMIAAMISGDVLPVPQVLAAALSPARFILRGLKRKTI